MFVYSINISNFKHQQVFFDQINFLSPLKTNSFWSWFYFNEVWVSEFLSIRVWFGLCLCGVRVSDRLRLSQSISPSSTTRGRRLHMNPGDEAAQVKFYIKLWEDQSEFTGKYWTYRRVQTRNSKILTLNPEFRNRKTDFYFVRFDLPVKIK